MLGRPIPSQRTMLETAFWLFLACGAAVLSTGFARPLSTDVFTSASWPRIIIAGIAIAAVGQCIFGDGPAGLAHEATEDRPPLPRLLTAVLLSGLYVQFIAWVGFYLVTPVFIIGYLLVFGERRPSRLLPFALAATVVFNLAFTTLLFISLPTGSIDVMHDINIAIQEAFIIGGPM